MASAKYLLSDMQYSLVVEFRSLPVLENDLDWRQVKEVASYWTTNSLQMVGYCTWALVVVRLHVMM